jgi:hypothetical protein
VLITCYSVTALEANRGIRTKAIHIGGSCSWAQQHTTKTFTKAISTSSATPFAIWITAPMRTNKTSEILADRDRLVAVLLLSAGPIQLTAQAINDAGKYEVQIIRRTHPGTGVIEYDAAIVPPE